MVNLKEILYSNQPKNGKFYTIAVDGRGGAGKTDLVEYIAKLVPDFTFLNGDDYFEPTPKAVAWGMFNDKRFIKDVIEPLKKGSTKITYRPFDWHAKPHITEKTLTINKGICIERCFSFAFDLNWDLRIWVETPSQVALKRGLKRDKMLRERAVKAWEQVWKPKEDSYIQSIDPLHVADIVIHGTKPFADQLY